MKYFVINSHLVLSWSYIYTLIHFICSSDMYVYIYVWMHIFKFLFTIELLFYYFFVEIIE